MLFILIESSTQNNREDTYYFAKEPHLLEEALNDDLLKVAQWLHGNKLTLNLTKTKSMIIGSNRKLVGISSFTLSIFFYF